MARWPESSGMPCSTLAASVHSSSFCSISASSSRSLEICCVKRPRSMQPHLLLVADDATRQRAEDGLNAALPHVRVLDRAVRQPLDELRQDRLRDDRSDRILDRSLGDLGDGRGRGRSELLLEDGQEGAGALRLAGSAFVGEPAHAPAAGSRLWRARCPTSLGPPANEARASTVRSRALMRASRSAPAAQSASRCARRPPAPHRATSGSAIRTVRDRSGCD